jgi:ssDNA-binding Zn-finger/Zn-ribbon topoisomerase 1
MPKIDFKALEPKAGERTCPRCGSPLAERRNKKGHSFMGCSTYPQCNYILTEPSDGFDDDWGARSTGGSDDYYRYAGDVYQDGCPWGRLWDN